MFVLNTPPNVANENPPTTAQAWETAAPGSPASPIIASAEGRVTQYRTGPGDVPIPRDEWQGTELRAVPHTGVMSGRMLFTGIPGPPPEGHGGYNEAGAQSNAGPKIGYATDPDMSLYWSDWYGSTAAQAGGGGSFRGEHVVIARVPPGSVQGYMPTDMTQANNARNTPAPWDANLTIGADMLAAVSQ